MRPKNPNKVRISVTVDPGTLEQIRERIGTIPLSRHIQALLKQELGMKKDLTKDETGMTSPGGILFGFAVFCVFWFIIWLLFFNHPKKPERKHKG